MTEKSASVEQKPITFQDCAGRALTTTQHHLPGYSVKNSTLDYAIWVSVGMKAKAERTGTDEQGNGASSTVHSFAGSLHPSRIEGKRIGKKQYWSMASKSDKEFLTELHGLFNIEFMYGVR
jgi:hypothetical protein